MVTLEQIYQEYYDEHTYIKSVIDRIPVHYGYTPEMFVEWLKDFVSYIKKRPIESITLSDLNDFLHEALEEEVQEVMYSPGTTGYERYEIEQEGITEYIIDSWLVWALKDIKDWLVKKEIEKGNKEAGMNLDF